MADERELERARKREYQRRYRASMLLLDRRLHASLTIEERMQERERKRASQQATCYPSGMTVRSPATAPRSPGGLASGARPIPPTAGGCGPAAGNPGPARPREGTAAGHPPPAGGKE